MNSDINYGQSQVQEPIHTGRNPLNILFISVLAIFIMLLLIASQLTYTITQSEMIHRGIKINNTDVGNLKPDEARVLLEKEFGTETINGSLTVNCGSISKGITYEELGVFYDIDLAVEEAFSVAREDNFLKQVYDVLLTARYGINIEMKTAYNKEKLKEYIEGIYKRIYIEKKDFSLSVEEAYVRAHSGHNGVSIDREAAFEVLDSVVLLHRDASVNIPLAINQREEVNIDDVYAKTVKTPVNAKAIVEDNSVVTIPHEVGRSIDREVLEQIIKKLAGENDMEVILPVLFVEPEITDDIARQMVFRDTLSSYDTKFNISTEVGRNRAKNIELAANEINGKMLGPGEIFSFNETVGPRSSETGYQTAQVYVNGEIVDGIGGGICQVSSTLYNAVLYAGLEVVERSNHMFTVSYVPAGLDATVSYGEVDFKFKNSTDWPLRIECRIENSDKIVFKIIGTDQNPGRNISLETNTRKTTKHGMVYIDDPQLPEGYTQIKQSGHDGHTVDTYMYIEAEDGTVEKKHLHTSYYRVLDEQIIRGTKKPSPSE